MRTVKFTLLFFLCTALLGACGLKGRLYLPEDKPAAEKSAPADAEPDKKKAGEKKNGSGGEPSSRH